MPKDTNNEKNLQESINKYWDKRSPEFSKVRRRELLSPDAERWRDFILNRLPNATNAKILDIGTGAGFFAVLLAKAGAQVTGIDMSEGMLKEAAANLQTFGASAELLRMNAQQPNFADESFDYVISRNLTWTLPDAMEAYRQWHRILKTGGRLLNFDSDRGKVAFTKKNDANDVHAGIADELISECNDIKNSLRISRHTRPEWDIALLEKIGFSVTCEPDVSPIIQKDEHLKRDELPLFALCAIKKPLPSI